MGISRTGIPLARLDREGTQPVLARADLFDQGRIHVQADFVAVDGLGGAARRNLVDKGLAAVGGRPQPQPGDHRRFGQVEVVHHLLALVGAVLIHFVDFHIGPVAVFGNIHLLAGEEYLAVIHGLPGHFGLAAV